MTSRRLIDRLAEPLDEIGRVLWDQSIVGSAIADRQGRLVRVNDALRRLLGTPAANMQGRQVGTLFRPADREALLNEMAAAIGGQPTPHSFLAALLVQGGEEQPVEVTVQAVREADGTVSGALLQLNDITLRSQLEAQLAQSQKLQAIGQLAGGIAHDFNNLLTAIMGAAEEASARQTIDAETLEDFEQIRAAARRGAALVRQLLAFGRQQRLEPTAIPVNGAVRALSGLLRRLLGSNVQLALDLQQPGCTVRADPGQLDQVLINLAVNARDAMRNGGTLTLRTGDLTLNRPLERGHEVIPPGRYAMIEVQDTGCGIPPEVLPRIFDPFFTTRRDQGGTGLGLSTVHGIIRQSDGFVAVDSLVNQGTRLRIYLPQYDEAFAETPQPGKIGVPELQAEFAGPRGRTILFVDDDAGIRHFATRALTRRGWHVLSADSAEAAMTLLAQPGCSVSLGAIISDVVMPGMDGPALVRAVRATCPGLPALLTSGYAAQAVLNEVTALGAVILAKPYSMADLVTALERQIGVPSPSPRSVLVNKPGSLY